MTTAGSVSYAYDWLGRRVSRTVSGGTTTCVYDGGQIIAEYNGGSLIRKYIYGPGIDEPVCMVASGGTYYYHFDGLGSVAALTDSGGTLVEKYPDDAMSYDAAMRLAQLKERQGQWLEAVEAYEFFLSRCGKDPRKVQTTFKLGNAYEQAGQKDLAFAIYSEYIRMAPVGDRYIPDAAKALLRLEGVGQ